MKTCPVESLRFTAGAHRYAAEAFANSPSAAQRAFAPTILEWAEGASRRADALEASQQPDLFGGAA